MHKIPNQTKTSWLWILSFMTVLLLSIVCFVPAMTGMAVWDDHALIGGPGIGGGDTLEHCFTKPFLFHYFRPLVSISFFIEHKISGSGPIFYHSTNILIHATTTAALVAMLLVIFSRRSVALLGGLAFAVQPAQVSTVAWIGGRTDSLATMWLSFFGWFLALAVREIGAKRVGFSIASSLMFFLAMMTKEQTATVLPLVLFAIPCFCFKGSKTPLRDNLLLAIPFAVMACLFIGLWVTYFPNPTKPELHSLSNQIYLGGNTILYYSLLLLAPLPKWMHMLSVGEFERFGMVSITAGYALMASYFALFIYCCKKAKTSAWFFAFVFLTSFPILNILPLPSIVVAPYRVGVTGLGIAALIGIGSASLIEPIVLALWASYKRKSSSSEGDLSNALDGGAGTNPPTEPTLSPGFRALRAFGGAMCCAGLIWMTGLTFWGSSIWQNEGTVFAQFSRYDPTSVIAGLNYSAALTSEHKYKEAEKQLDKLLCLIFKSDKWRTKKNAVLALSSDANIYERIREVQGNSIDPEKWLADVFAQIGFARLTLDKVEEGKLAFETGYAVERYNHNVNLGLAQLAYNDGHYSKAVGYLKVAATTRVGHTELYVLLSKTLMQMGKWKEAQTAVKTWTELQGWNGKAYIQLAATQSRQGNYDDARKTLEIALKTSICDSTEVNARLADLHGRAGNPL